MNRFLRGVARATIESFALPDPVLEIGSYQVEGQEDLIDLRGLFPGRPYTGVDFRAGPGVDLVADVEKLPLPDASVGTRPPTSVTAARKRGGSILSSSKCVAPAAIAGSI